MVGQCTSEPQSRARTGLISTQGLTARSATVLMDKWCTRLLVVRHWRNLDIAHPSSAIRLSTAKEASPASHMENQQERNRLVEAGTMRHYIKGGMREVLSRRHNFDKGTHMPSAAKREHVCGPDAVTLRFIFRPLSSRFFKPQLNNRHQFLEAVGQPGVPGYVSLESIL